MNDADEEVVVPFNLDTALVEIDSTQYNGKAVGMATLTMTR